MTDISGFVAALGDIPTVTDPMRVKQKSRDYYWYSPVLKKRFDQVVADIVVVPRSEADIVAIARASFRHDVPLTVRGNGTGNYGQAMPIKGGAVVDVSMLEDLLWVKPGLCRVQAGKKVHELERELAGHGQELRMIPSTARTATIGGYIAGGSGGIGSVTWGLLRDPGNIGTTRIVTVEAEPRVLELKGDAIQKIAHSYGCTGIITELEMPLTARIDWIDAIVGFDQLMDAARFAQALAEEPGILKRECAVQAAPIPQTYFKPLAEFIPAGKHCVFTMIAAHHWDNFADFAKRHAATVLYRKTAHEVEEERRVPIYEYCWNHTTLWALKVDPGLTYLQTWCTPGQNLEQVEKMARHFGDEILTHLEFIRDKGSVTCAGLQLVRFTTEQRLNEIMAYTEQIGCQQFNAHAHTLEEGGMKQVDRQQLLFKHEIDPKGLLNPGKMLGWDDPDWRPESDRRSRAAG